MTTQDPTPIATSVELRTVQRLFDIGPMQPPDLVRYSKAPVEVLCSDGQKYVCKGIDPTDAVAELLGYLLAARVGLPTPDFALVSLGPTTDARHFGSRLVDLRMAPEVLIGTRRARNPEFFGECAAFDLWTCNDDRNTGNVVGRSVGGRGDAEFEWLAIDFESARILRGESALVLNTRRARDFLPREDLAKAAGLSALPAAMIRSIQGVGEAELMAISERVRLAFPRDFSYAERVVAGLTSRARLLPQLAAEAFHV